MIKIVFFLIPNIMMMKINKMLSLSLIQWLKQGLLVTQYLATYWADKNVRCNALCPKGVEKGQPEEFLKEVNARIPMGRMANADEYQGTLIWMLSKSSSYLNGAIVPVGQCGKLG